MYAGDQARKKALIEFGFRLPSAKDNRPLKFEEAERFFKDVIFVSATPGEYELEHSDIVAEQLIRPTGIIDPAITILPREGQLDALYAEIKKTSSEGGRTLVTVLTKKLAEELSHHLEKQGVKVCYLHHDLKTPQRTEIIHKLRSGIFECLIGINLLREGLDMPEVALIAIMDADIESFLRDKRSLIQTIGRAARNQNGRVVFFADSITKSMRAAMEETERRRHVQQAYNIKHNIVPQSTKRTVQKAIVPLGLSSKTTRKPSRSQKGEPLAAMQVASTEHIERLRAEMTSAAERLDFEAAIRARDQLLELLQKQPKK